MSTHRPHRVTRTSAQQTLASLARGASHRDEPVAKLLSTLVAPALDRETAGERQALSMLRAAQRTSTETDHTGTLARRLKQVLTVKIAVAAAVLTIGGIALAAGSGGLARALSGRTVGSASRPPTAASAPDATGQSTSRSTNNSSAPVGPDPTPVASTAALIASCGEFNALSAGDQRQALRGQDFADLVRAADGPNRVSAFCAVLLAVGSPEPHARSGSVGASSHPVHPTRPSHPTHPSRPNS